MTNAAKDASDATKPSASSTQSTTSPSTPASRVIRGAILFAWISFLASAALLSLANVASKRLLDLATRIADTSAQTRPSKRVGAIDTPELDIETGAGVVKRSCRTATDYLRDWDIDGAAPPVEAMLDEMCPNWQVDDQPSAECTLSEIERTRDSYEDVFNSIARILGSLVIDKDTNLREFRLQSGSLIQEKLCGKSRLSEIALPRPAIDWIMAQRQSRTQHEKNLALLDTFLLIMVIGAFGSLTFLIRDFVTNDTKNTFADYVFRPLLGIFLAMATFVLDLLAHSILSKAGLSELRYEPLYVLALAAGLLSEQAYLAVEARANRAIANYRRQGEADSKGPEPKHDPPAPAGGDQGEAPAGG